ncbi:GNAT family N-acetyltransferase [Listeria monocytogenes]|uniref:GNAT family N-acetyltransferase n=1 Tax=Bacilli TaxID=91061 RepID=UPI0008747DDE|nr:GNAT family N-acetyltransferase [Listeria monocytogenes]EAE3710521.1 GNAT family N-acetyltransferase [Listeria monocytogenes serotype 1/2b]EAC3180764.1 GNAT family N-acetyltransferase [Listeria monocytogenes]EAC4040900.1 GNAT family N-acetyltransferase [Listeria monocytogenes]EAC4503178.1 GNAT family N-acetyltransferase [Listeria monocytogenes]EAC6741591.1 GNAT family N-acetyltransferase [Listeria monocytogenes]
MSIIVEKAKLKDVENIELIIDSCKKILKKSGSPQWSDEDEPTKASLVDAIENNLVYIFMVNQRIVGTAILTKQIEPAYSSLEYGSWVKASLPYYSIHRFAIDPSENGKGYAKLFFKLLTVIALEAGAKDIRVDTHPLNVAMQKVILANGFNFKGIIKLPISNGERYAYQKVCS